MADPVRSPTVFPPPSGNLVADLSALLAAGHSAKVIGIEMTGPLATRLGLRSTGCSVLTMQEIALFLLEKTISQARELADGSAVPALPHLDDAFRSLQAAFAALDDAKPARPIVGHA